MRLVMLAIHILDLPPHGHTRVLIQQACKWPHSYFVFTSAHLQNRKRVFILGPSHHVYLDGCALSKCSTYETPIGSLPLDLDSKL
jgi:predicted class III extradiol MEMO1 family dioxygenase